MSRLAGLRVPGIGAVDAAGADYLYGGRAEGAAYYIADADRSTGFVAVSDGKSLVAASPSFEIDFDSSRFAPSLASLVALVRRVRPRFWRLRIGGLGAIHTGQLGLAIDPGLDAGGRDAALEAVLRAADEDRPDRPDITIVKDVSDRDAAWADPILRRCGYRRIQGLPMAWLHLPFASVEDYLASLPRNARRSLQRNWRDAQAITTEVTTDITGLAEPIQHLIDSTRRHASIQFDGLDDIPAEFFVDMGRLLPGQSRFFLHRLGDRLLGFAFCMVDGRAVYGKNLGLDYPDALDHKLYFHNFRSALELTLAEGRQWLALGQLRYDIKLRWGARLERRWIYYRPKPAWAWSTDLFAPVVGRARLDPSLAQLTEARYWFADSPDLPQPPVQLMQSSRP